MSIYLISQYSPDSATEWTAVKVENTIVVNVYKPPGTRMAPLSLPVFTDGASCLCASVFTSHHTDSGFTQANADGLCLAQWAPSNGLKLLYNPQGGHHLSLSTLGQQNQA